MSGRRTKNEPVYAAVLWLVHFKFGVNIGLAEKSTGSRFSKKSGTPEAGNRAGKTTRP